MSPLLFGDAIFRVHACLLFNFQERVDIFFEQFIRGVGKVPHFVNLYNSIIFLQRFLQLHATPRTPNGSLAFGMGTRVLITGIGACSAKGKHQFALGAVGKDGMEQTSRWKHRTFDQPEIGGDVIEALGDNTRVSYNCPRHLVTPRVQTREIHISVK